MGTATIAVFRTQKMAQNDSIADEKVFKYVSDMFSDVGHNIQTVQTYATPNPPTEAIFSTITDTVCGNRQKTYNGLLEWWYDYHRCNNLREAADANLLLTNSSSLSGEGYIGGNLSVAAGAQISNLPLDKPARENSQDNPRHNAMHVAVHEAGHNFGLYHKDGYVWKNSPNFTVSPMMSGYAYDLDGENNNCNNRLSNVDYSMDRHLGFNWTNCATNHMNL